MPVDYRGAATVQAEAPAKHGGRVLDVCMADNRARKGCARLHPTEGGTSGCDAAAQALSPTRFRARDPLCNTTRKVRRRCTNPSVAKLQWRKRIMVEAGPARK